eukprot:CAMPEP_0119105312 /NCGR_PEP_ID=MMETSP1180-20130426/3309_1 /TAXON_ID=3052 ORGANISM="Chlamydomonas cf sp, Strain CCMP681" /NCGR_SAMPLE_ID=MMETSP1180 /ASSEMBLY_ACC=CAM_ASM_000741 /LENGTH=88 /DNA_ID=CAMNT_0007090327 /DNA_START=141 /DNA_END=403 /DNA_ORIENTATION=+
MNAWPNCRPTPKGLAAELVPGGVRLTAKTVAGNAWAAVAPCVRAPSRGAEALCHGEAWPEPVTGAVPEAVAGVRTEAVTGVRAEAVTG